MPYSDKQRRAAGLALAVKRGKVNARLVGVSVRNMVRGMSEGELRDFAGGRVKRIGKGRRG